jgi:hypothetical protein
MTTLRNPLRFSAVLLVALAAFSAPAWAGGGHHGGHHGYGDHWSVGIGLNFGYPYPGPYPGGYYGAPYGYYPGYPYGYGPAYGGRIGIGYRSGYYDGWGVGLSLPLYVGPRYAPPQPVLVPAPQVVSRAAPADCTPTREYQTEIVIDGEAVPAWGTACLQADGSWRILTGPFAE